MSQPEAKLSRDIQRAIKGRGAWCYKVWGNELTPAGIPDIVGTYRGIFIGIETKMPQGKLSTMQKYRIRTIREHGGCVVVARSVGDALQMLTHIDQHHFHQGEKPWRDDPQVCSGDPCPYQGTKDLTKD